MAEPHRHADEANEALDPEVLYTKEYCIGQSAGLGSWLSWFWSLMLWCLQAVVALARCSRGMSCPVLSCAGAFGYDYYLWLVC